MTHFLLGFYDSGKYVESSEWSDGPHRPRLVIVGRRHDSVSNML